MRVFSPVSACSAVARAALAAAVLWALAAPAAAQPAGWKARTRPAPAAPAKAPAASTPAPVVTAPAAPAPKADGAVNALGQFDPAIPGPTALLKPYASFFAKAPLAAGTISWSIPVREFAPDATAATASVLVKYAVSGEGEAATFGPVPSDPFGVGIALTITSQVFNPATGLLDVTASFAGKGTSAVAPGIAALRVDAVDATEGGRTEYAYAVAVVYGTGGKSVEFLPLPPMPDDPATTSLREDRWTRLETQTLWEAFQIVAANTSETAFEETTRFYRLDRTFPEDLFNIADQTAGEQERITADNVTTQTFFALVWANFQPGDGHSWHYRLTDLQRRNSAPDPEDFADFVNPADWTFTAAEEKQWDRADDPETTDVDEAATIDPARSPGGFSVLAVSPQIGRLDSGEVLLTATGVTATTYVIQYADTFTFDTRTVGTEPDTTTETYFRADWVSATGAQASFGSRFYWVDQGLPHTPVSSKDAPQRIYRILQYAYEANATLEP